MSAILQLSPYTPDSINSDLEHLAPTHHLWKLKDSGTLPAQIAQTVTIVATKGDLGLPRALMNQLPNLQLISVYGVGYDGIDLSEAKTRGIRITTTPESLTNAVADMAVALALAGSRRLVEGDHFVRAGHWLDRKLGTGFDIRGKRVGIFGYGRIGRKIAQILQAFDCTTLYYDINQHSDSTSQSVGSLQELAEQSRVFIVSASGGPKTRNAVNRQILEALGPDGLLVNVARGSIVNQSDLIEALENGTIGGACLDVFEDEPNVPNALCKANNVILTPHISSATHETRLNMGRVLTDNINAFLSGESLLTPLHL